MQSPSSKIMVGKVFVVFFYFFIRTCPNFIKKKCGNGKI
jgi:hypothetical protein